MNEQHADEFGFCCEKKAEKDAAAKSIGETADGQTKV
jgi:hypothetical protein